MSQGSGRSWMDERRAERRARQRRERWEQLHGNVTPQNVDWNRVPSEQNAAGPPARRASGARTSRVEPAGRGRFLVLLLAAAGVLLAVTGAGGTPLASTGWSPLLLVGGICGAGMLSWIAYHAWPAATPTLRFIAVVLGVGALLAAGVGAVSQNSVDGKVQLRGSDLDDAIELHEAMSASLTVLRDNQRLFQLTDEQALGLGDTFRAAFDQAVRIGERWNPATLGEVPLPAIADAAAVVNLAAARQAAAFERHLANLATPEDSVQAQAVELAAQVDVLLTSELPAALDVVVDAIREAAA